MVGRRHYKVVANSRGRPKEAQLSNSLCQGPCSRGKPGVDLVGWPGKDVRSHFRPVQLLQDSRSQPDTQGLQQVVGSIFQVHTAPVESVSSPHVPAPGHFASDTVLPTPASPVYAMYLPLLYSLFPVYPLPCTPQYQGPGVGTSCTHAWFSEEPEVMA